MTKENKELVVKTKAKDLEVGQELYDFYLDDNDHVKMVKVYVIKKNKTNFYFSYSKYDRTNSYMRLKTTGTLPKLWRPSFIESHYISDDKSFGEKWKKESKDRSELKRDIQEYINDLTYHGHSNEDLKKVRDFLRSVV